MIYSISRSILNKSLNNRSTTIITYLNDELTLGEVHLATSARIEEYSLDEYTRSLIRAVQQGFDFSPLNEDYPRHSWAYLCTLRKRQLLPMLDYQETGTDYNPEGAASVLNKENQLAIDPVFTKKASSEDQGSKRLGRPKGTK